ncbi:forkhead box protein H1-like [Rhineura floridana]|uniref:forkhead box protein H1-like n=1 Tax=Rhineura floridana TaxID=261503 RepID=UPI002AC85ADF|nr:forkhead box protein H1-like [Rhineura floridana]
MPSPSVSPLLVLGNQLWRFSSSKPEEQRAEPPMALAMSALPTPPQNHENGSQEERILALPQNSALDKEAPEATEEPDGRQGEGPANEMDKKVKRKKKNYNRHPKPPYTYLAMIALVIQASPSRKLKLSQMNSPTTRPLGLVPAGPEGLFTFAFLAFQIINEISTRFPFFKEGYQGWKDSIRHNLSSNDCFYKVLKDPTKPKAKGNFWTVDVNLIPPEALKLQNTPISRQEERTFAVDLAPYVYHEWPLRGSSGSSRAPHNAAASEETPCLASQGPQQSTSFTIDSLLSDFQEVGLCGKPKAGPELPPHVTAGLDVWGPVPIYQVSSGPPVLPWRPSCHLPTLRSFSSSSSLSSLGSLSPNEREARRQRPGKKGPGPHALAKRPRVLQAPESSDSDSEGGPPPPPAPHWEQLPTSYTKCVAPNVVAPTSHSPPFSTFPTVPGLPLYSPAPFPSPVYWELIPRPLLSPAQSSRLSVELDQSMPPNKTVFDAWMAHPADVVNPGVGWGSPFFRSSVVARYEPS